MKFNFSLTASIEQYVWIFSFRTLDLMIKMYLFWIQIQRKTNTSHNVLIYRQHNMNILDPQLNTNVCAVDNVHQVLFNTSW